MTNQVSQATTLQFTVCIACGAERLLTDKYCRRCGANQQDSEAYLHYANKATLILQQTSSELDTEDILLSDDPWHYSTTPLACGEQATANLTTNLSLTPLRAYHKVSGSLVQQIATTFSKRFMSETRHLLMRKTLLALVSIPIWLLIILLSPLDAYAAAKSVTRQM